VSAELEDVLEEAALGKGAAAYLLWGEEFLVRKGAEELVSKLVPNPAAGLNLIVLDGASPRELAQELATLPLFPGPKVVVCHDPEFLLPKKGRGDALGKARDAWKAGRRKEGARRLLALLARAGWGVAELNPRAPGAPSADRWQEELNVELAEADLAFLAEVAAFCKEEGIAAPEGDTSVLVGLLARGVPKGHALVLAASDVDAKNPLVRAIQERGGVVERKVAARLKDLDLSELAAEVLGPQGKRLGPGAEEALKDRCGGNMRLLQSELEKLSLFAEGKLVSVEDVRLLVGRAREEEFLELSDALQKRDLRAALRYVQDALGQGSHALQLLGAVASIVRTLLENRERLAELGGSVRMSFNDFKAQYFPRIEQEAKAAKRRPPHPYAVYAGLQAAARYDRRELLKGLVGCAEADLALKSSGNGQLVLERLLWQLCMRSVG
jgi:DNA polymerase III subunit delta